MEIEQRERPVSPKKPTNQDNPIMFDDTPVKANEVFEDVMEHLNDLLLLDEKWHFLVDINPFFGRYAPKYFLGYIM